MNRLSRIFDGRVDKLITNLAYAAPELQRDKIEQHRSELRWLAEQLYDALGPAADDILEDL